MPLKRPRNLERINYVLTTHFAFPHRPAPARVRLARFVLRFAHIQVIHSLMCSAFWHRVSNRLWRESNTHRGDGTDPHGLTVTIRVQWAQSMTTVPRG